MISIQNERRSMFGAVDLLSFAATPTFAIMAVVAQFFGADAPAMICSMSQDTLTITGMVPMYALMSIFHSGPWLNLFARHLNAMYSI